MPTIMNSLLRVIKTPQHFQSVPVIIEVKKDAQVQAVASQISQALGIEVKQIIPFVNSFSMVIPSEMVTELGAIGLVEKVHFDRPMYGFQSPLPPPPDPLGILSGSPFGEINQRFAKLLANPQIMVSMNDGWIPTAEANKGINVYPLHKEGIQGQGVKVWVLDTGVDQTNPQLQGAVEGAYSTTAGTPHDGNGHGSWCCSRIVGKPYTHPILGLDMMGAAPECSLSAVKVLTDIGFGNTSDILRGMQLALDNNADIVSMSLGGDGNAEEEEDDLMVKFINKAAIEHPRVIFVIAAGNSGSEGERAGKTIGIPACAEEALTVGSWSILDQARAYYSSTGPTLQAARIKPDIVGQGGGRAMASGYSRGMGDIFSGSAFGSQLDPLDRIMDGFCPLKGTSMATPEVAGVLALWKQLVPELTTRDVKGIFNLLGQPKNNAIGHGLINATWIYKAMGG